MSDKEIIKDNSLDSKKIFTIECKNIVLREVTLMLYIILLCSQK